jgi:hypothetical protein
MFLISAMAVQMVYPLVSLSSIQENIDYKGYRILLYTVTGQVKVYDVAPGPYGYKDSDPYRWETRITYGYEVVQIVTTPEGGLTSVSIIPYAGQIPYGTTRDQTITSAELAIDQYLLSPSPSPSPTPSTIPTPTPSISMFNIPLQLVLATIGMAFLAVGLVGSLQRRKK